MRRLTSGLIHVPSYLAAFLLHTYFVEYILNYCECVQDFDLGMACSLATYWRWWNVRGSALPRNNTEKRTGDMIIDQPKVRINSHPVHSTLVEVIAATRTFQ